MGIETEADRRISEATSKINEALELLGPVISKSVWGWDEFVVDRRDELRKAFQLILEASDLL